MRGGAFLVLTALRSAALNTGGARLARLLEQLDADPAGPLGEQLQAVEPAIRREAQALAKAAAHAGGFEDQAAPDQQPEELSA